MGATTVDNVISVHPVFAEAVGDDALHLKDADAARPVRSFTHA
jgi:hypothetical protein